MSLLADLEILLTYIYKSFETSCCCIIENRNLILYMALTPENLDQRRSYRSEGSCSPPPVNRMGTKR
jgi:hypothetical protein